MVKYIIPSIVIVALLFLAAVYLFSDKEKGLPGDQVSLSYATTTDQYQSGGGGSATATASAGTASTTTQTKTNHMITLETNKGTIVLETYDADAPNTVNNFVTLANKGFYNGLTFHRVIPGFMIQGGDPNGNGTGGPGYTFADELNPETPSYKAGYKKGVLAMANAGPNTNGSQFFIMTADYPLPHNYTIFGKVVSGQEVVDAIAGVARDSHDKPLSPVVMKKVTVQ